MDLYLVSSALSHSQLNQLKQSFVNKKMMKKKVKGQNGNKMLRRTNFLFMVFLLVLASCGSISYKYYHLVPTDDGKLEGKLIGEKPKDDTDLQKFCIEPNGSVKCVVLSIDDYFQIMEDLEVTKKMLEDCERKLP